MHLQKLINVNETMTFERRLQEKSLRFVTGDRFFGHKVIKFFLGDYKGSLQKKKKCNIFYIRGGVKISPRYTFQKHV